MVCASAFRIAAASMECVAAYASISAAVRILSVAYDCAAQATGSSPYVCLNITLDELLHSPAYVISMLNQPIEVTTSPQRPHPHLLPPQYWSTREQ